MKKLLAAALLAALPGAAGANCGTAMAMCTYTPPGSGSRYELPCSFASCSTASAVFDFFRFEDASYARFDHIATGDILDARFDFAADPFDTRTDTVYQRVPASMETIQGGDPYFAIISVNGQEILYVGECGAPCEGINADEFGQ